MQELGLRGLAASRDQVCFSTIGYKVLKALVGD